jgi:hypothetical protein
MYDITFISYEESNADENWKNLKDRFPLAKRIHGIKGIHQAHIAAAKQCYTDMFWIVDGDAQIVPSFNFQFKVDNPYHLKTVHVWRSKNPVNGLIYGYGGVKLFPRQLTINMDLSKPDMTTSISDSFKKIEELSNITCFNTDPFSAWKAGFRECAKLASKVIDRQKDDETVERLKIWTTVGKDATFGNYVIDGALNGELWGKYNRDDKSKLFFINDFNWLKEKFNERFGS